VIFALRFIGLFNAAIWIGTAIFGAFVALPTFFSPEMKAVIPEPYNGLAAQILLHRYFLAHYICSAIAISHLLGEFLYLGRPLDRWVAIILSVIVAIGIVEGVKLEPKLKSLFVLKYHPTSTPAQKQAASASFSTLHGISQGLNLVVICGVAFYFWKVARPIGGPRYGGTPKLGG
jgi:predicted small integral membrane protein